MYNHIPRERPDTPVLDSIGYPSDFRQFSVEQLRVLADELRHFLLYTVGQTGGHFSAGLGVVELTIALHYVFDTPEDLLIWDVGHQTYPHKILTHRREKMSTLRSVGGIAPFPDPDESAYDTFAVGHSSTSIGAATGMAIANRLRNENKKIVAVIGDGAIAAGQAFEALNFLAGSGEDVLVILNDNAMSISGNVGGLAAHFADILLRNPISKRSDKESKSEDIPALSARSNKVNTEFLYTGLGLSCSGPVDGHDLSMLITQLEYLKKQNKPRLLHVATKKGKGYGPAENSPDSLHSMTKISGLESAHDSNSVMDKNSQSKTASERTYSNHFGQWLCDMAAADEDLVAITPAMREGSDLVDFSKKFPQRYIDVGIAEQHAITLAAGLASAGSKPVVAIYSTFLQRGYDQLLHDVAIANLDVLFAIDRSGLVEDGATHSGVFDISYLRCIPNLLIMAPADENQLRRMLNTGYHYKGPAAVRYPRGTCPGAKIDPGLDALKIGSSHTLREGKKIALLSFGTMLEVGRQVAEELDTSLIDMRFIKPLDIARINSIIATHELIVTLEEHVITGGAGSAVNEYLATVNCPAAIFNIGIPDEFIAHGNPQQQLAACHLDAKGVIRSIKEFQKMVEGKFDS